MRRVSAQLHRGCVTQESDARKGVDVDDKGGAHVHGAVDDNVNAYVYV